MAEPFDAEDFVLSAGYGELAELQTALEAGAPVDSVDPNGNTALMMAAANGHTEIVSALLAKNAKAGLQNAHGNTALHWAGENGQLGCVELLLAPRDGDGELFHADANVKNEAGKKPFDAAFARNHTDVCEALAKRTSWEHEAVGPLGEPIPTEEEIKAEAAAKAEPAA